MDDDIPLLNTPNLVALILREADAGGASAEACADRLGPLLGARGVPRRNAPDRTSVIAACALRIRWLCEARLVEPRDGRWAITARGRESLSAHPEGMDLAELAAYPEFAAWLDSQDAAEHPEGSPPARATAYDEGFVARHQGAAFTDNPYDFATADHQTWEKGWCEALDEEEGPARSALTARRRDAN